jgi:CRISPR-associated protein Cas1
MDRNSQFSATDDCCWAERSGYWNSYLPTRRGRRKKYRFREPLILCGHGASIRVDQNTLLVKSGFTYYPQKSEQIRFFPGDPNMPDRIIILDASGAISFDALNWMSDQEIGLIQLDWRGRVNFSGNSGFSANSKLVKWQVEIRDTKKALELNRKLIAAKFDACCETLIEIFGNSQISKDAIGKIKPWRAKVLNAIQANSSGRILGYEGMAAWMYYQTWHDLPLKWAGLRKRPVPDSWLKVGSRSMSWQRESNNARHPINAMLNYGYAILASSVHTKLVANGFDPSIGFAHRRESNRIPLVYDLMEPLRPEVDRMILGFALANTFTPGDFTINSKGGCRLNPQMAKALVHKVSGIDVSRAIQFYSKNVRT